MMHTGTSEDFDFFSLTKEEEEEQEISVIKAKDVKYNYDIKLNGKIKIRNAIYQDKIVAIKLSDDPKDEELSNSLIKEMRILACLKHDNIVEMYGGIFEPNRNPQIVIELMDKNLFDILTRVKLSLFERIELAKEACKGMMYLEKMQVYHGDYKTENVLYDVRTRRVKIADFGFSEKMKQKDNKTDVIKGTPYYLAPELFLERRYGSYSDVYSFGISLSVHINRKMPYDHNYDTNQFLNLVAAPVFLRPELPFNESECPNSLRQLVIRCWHPSSGARPSFSEIYSELDNILVDCLFSNSNARFFWKNFFVSKNFGLMYDVHENHFLQALKNCNFSLQKIEEARRYFICNGNVNIHQFEKFSDLFFC